jgi:serine phosphatase RsbU (regulator of sigma subunit)
VVVHDRLAAEKPVPELQGLSAEKFAQSLLAEIKRFMGEFQANDDLSLIVLKRQSESAEHQTIRLTN